MILMMVFRLFFSASKYLCNSDDDGEDDSDEANHFHPSRSSCSPIRASMIRLGLVLKHHSVPINN